MIYNKKGRKSQICIGALFMLILIIDLTCSYMRVTRSAFFYGRSIASTFFENWLIIIYI